MKEAAELIQNHRSVGTMESPNLQSVLTALLGSCGLIAASFLWFDAPIALYCAHYSRDLAPLGYHLGSSVLVAGEAFLALALSGYRIRQGRLHPFAKVTLVACATSLSTFALNEMVLKPLFGVPPPIDVFSGVGSHAVHLFHGSYSSSFPSGHIALASSFSATFVRQSVKTFALLSIATCLAALLLVVGDWHFLSDVVAGGVVGSLAGITAATLWTEHNSRLAQLAKSN